MGGSVPDWQDQSIAAPTVCKRPTGAYTCTGELTRAWTLKGPYVFHESCVGKPEILVRSLSRGERLGKQLFSCRTSPSLVLRHLSVGLELTRDGFISIDLASRPTVTAVLGGDSEESQPSTFP